MVPDIPGDRLATVIDRERRRFLQASAVGLTAGTGCLAGDFPDGDTNSRAVPASNNDDRGGSTPQTDRSATRSDSAASVDYTLNQAGQVSAAVYDSNGHLVRTLLRGVEQDAGQHTIEWDGLDRHGRPQSSGEYSIRVLHKPPFEAEFVTQVGVNPNSEPYHEWLGNHDGPASVAVDDSGMYVAGQITEGPPVLLKQTLDGTERLWTKFRGDVTYGRYQGGITLAVDGGRLYMLQQNGYVQVIDAETGEYIGPGRPQRGNLRSQRVDPDERTTWDVLPAGRQRKYEGGDSIFIYRHGETVAGVDLAAASGTIAVSYRDREAVRWLTAEGETETEVEVPSPLGIAVGPRGGTFVVSEGRIVQVIPEGATRPVVTGLVTPRRLAVDPTSGDLLVAEGEPDHRVKRFDGQGNLKRMYGREGGRQEGPYAPTDYRGVTDVEATGDGGFLITEPHVAPRRVAHVDADGSVVDEWYGGQPFFSWKAVDPENPSEVWFQSGSGWAVQAEVDYEAGEWSVAETHHVESKADGLGHMLGTWSQFQPRRVDGERYLMGESIPQVFHHADGKLTPLCVGGSGSGRGSKTEVVRIGELRGVENPEEWWETKWKNWRTREYEEYFWSDGDGDRTPSGDEITLGESLLGGNALGVAPDGSIVATRDGALQRHPVQGWRDGVPQFGIGDETATELVGKIESDLEETMGGRFGNVDGIGSNGKWDAHATREGSHYLLSTFGPNHGTSWPGNSYGGRTRLTKWDSEGERRWSVGRHATVSNYEIGATPPGYLHEPTRINGVVREAVVVTDRVANPGLAYTTDGLFAGSLLADRVDDGLPGWVYQWGAVKGKSLMNHDCAQGGAVTKVGGEVYWLAPGGQSTPVYRIHGWDDWERIEGTVTLTEAPAHASGKGSGLRGTYFDDADADLDGSPTATRTDESIWFGIQGAHRNPDASRSWGRFGPDGRVGRHANARDWSSGPAEGVSAPFAARWTGEVEAQLSEAFRFTAYAVGGARLWVDGEQVVSAWEGSQVQHVSNPVRLTAGERYAVRLEYRATSAYPALSLNWDSFTQERERIPTAYLYPNE